MTAYFKCYISFVFVILMANEIYRNKVASHKSQIPFSFFSSDPGLRMIMNSKANDSFFFFLSNNVIQFIAICFKF
jgi:pyruvate/2-oxoglutarate/acetoin dehydrogenase E1 component